MYVYVCVWGRGEGRGAACSSRTFPRAALLLLLGGCSAVAAAAAALPRCPSADPPAQRKFLDTHQLGSRLSKDREWHQLNDSAPVYMFPLLPFPSFSLVQETPVTSAICDPEAGAKVDKSEKEIKGVFRSCGVPCLAARLVFTSGGRSMSAYVCWLGGGEGRSDGRCID